MKRWRVDLELDHEDSNGNSEGENLISRQALGTPQQVLDSSVLAREHGVRLLPIKYTSELTVVVHGTYQVARRLKLLNKFLMQMRARVG